MTKVDDPIVTREPAAKNNTDTAAAGFEDLPAKGTHDHPKKDEVSKNTFATGFLKVGVASEGSKEPVKGPT